MGQLQTWHLAQGCMVAQGQNEEIQLLPFSLLDRKSGSFGTLSALFFFLMITAACFFCAWYFVGSFHFSNLLKNLCSQGVISHAVDEETQDSGGRVTDHTAGEGQNPDLNLGPSHSKVQTLSTTLADIAFGSPNSVL